MPAVLPGWQVFALTFVRPRKAYKHNLQQITNLSRTAQPTCMGDHRIFGMEPGGDADLALVGDDDEEERRAREYDRMIAERSMSMVTSNMGEYRAIVSR